MHNGWNGRRGRDRSFYAANRHSFPGEGHAVMPEQPAQPAASPSPAHSTADEQPSVPAVSRGEWIEWVTGHAGIRSAYLSLASHLVLAILLTLLATHPVSQPQRLAPVILDFGPEADDDWGETRGDDATATLIAEATDTDDPAEAAEAEPAEAAAVAAVSEEAEDTAAADRPATQSPAAGEAAGDALAQNTPTDPGMGPATPAPAPAGGGAEKSANHGLAGQAAAARASLGRRAGTARGEAAVARGGSPASEAAVERGLLWLARHQAADGSWKFAHPHCIDPFGNPTQACPCRAKGYIEGHTKASTAIALLPFLGAGNTHLQGPYKEVVYRGLEQLKTTLDIELKELHPGDADFVPTFSGDLYGYGITTLVMAEAFGMTGDPDLEKYAAALATFLARHQHPLGGWRYEIGQPGDITVTGWQVVALKSSQLAGLPVHSDIFRQVDRFLTSLTPPAPPQRGQARLVGEHAGQARDMTRYHYLASFANSTTRQPNECTSAVGLLCRLYTGWKRNDPRLMEGIERLLESKTHPALQLYRNFYLAQILLQTNHPAWSHWNRRNRDYLVRMQVTKTALTDPTHPAFGGGPCEIGSWYLWNPKGATKNTARDRHLEPAGRLAHTALAILTLEVYYRLLPVYTADAVDD